MSSRWAVGIGLGNHYAFLGFAVFALGCFGDAFFAQRVNGAFEIAGGFFEGFFTIHHTCAGHFAQFLNIGGRNFYFAH